ncbi:hypothetical protein BN946_scf184660.g2 [Trametes cinnabarina]|uniref:Uncharacterized protein n=1 Tax=Pycnoporus cinnabarinus TaxID=5643 RepID=A0A060SV72_PYCCI|nr:hypothetical protein BN946_scf184660.g2 [Trametes cinnabarina]
MSHILRKINAPNLRILEIEIRADFGDVQLLRRVASSFPSLVFLRIHRYWAEGEREIPVVEIGRALSTLQQLHILMLHLDFLDLPDVDVYEMNHDPRARRDQLRASNATFAGAANILALSLGPSAVFICFLRPTRYYRRKWEPFRVIRSSGEEGDSVTARDVSLLIRPSGGLSDPHAVIKQRRVRWSLSSTPPYVATLPISGANEDNDAYEDNDTYEDDKTYEDDDTYEDTPHSRASPAGSHKHTLHHKVFGVYLNGHRSGEGSSSSRSAGIAAGKSTTSALLRGHGVPIMYTDVLTHKVVEPGTVTFVLSARAFRPHVLCKSRSRACTKAFVEDIIMGSVSLSVLETCLSGPPQKAVDNDLPHITIQIPVPQESLEAILGCSVKSRQDAEGYKPQSSYAHQGGTSTILVNNDSLRLLPSRSVTRKSSYKLLCKPWHGLGCAPKLHHSSPKGFMCVGPIKKVSRMDYALAFKLSLKDKKHLDMLPLCEKSWTRHAGFGLVPDVGSCTFLPGLQGISEGMRYAM